MEVYILKSVACLAILFGFYKLVLENTSLHTTKRFFLLGSLIVSLLIPFITFTEYVEEMPYATESFVPSADYETPIVQQIENNINYLPYILIGLYGLGVLFFSIRFGRNMWRILKNTRQHPAIKKSSIFHVLLNFAVTPHSFFNYIFFNKDTYETGKIPKEVIAHETAHVKQKHSWDIVFFELFRIVFWFNPLFYFIKKSIKLNHEFMADRAVLNQGADPINYQNILLDFSSGSGVQQLAHSINYSSIKKRFTVMKTHTSRRTAWFKGFLVLPLMALLIYGFSETREEYIENTNAHTTAKTVDVLDISITDESTIFQGNKKIKLAEFEKLVREENYTTAALNLSSKVSVPFAKSVVAELVRLDIANRMSVCTSSDSEGNGISREELDEITSPLINRFKNKETTGASPKQIEIYNQLAKKYNAVPISERKIGWEDLKTLERIYSQMNLTQRENSAPFPKCELKEKEVTIEVKNSTVSINYTAVSLKSFANTLDKVTMDWTPEEIKGAYLNVRVQNANPLFVEKLEYEYKKTQLYQHKKNRLVPPPPPPPAPPQAPKVIKGVNDGDPNVPPPPPPAPKITKGVNDVGATIPPPPPPPVSPLDHIIKMAKKNATFYFEGKEITSDKAIEIIKTNSNLNIQTTGHSSKNPQVKISTKPITVDSN